MSNKIHIVVGIFILILLAFIYTKDKRERELTSYTTNVVQNDKSIVVKEVKKPNGTVVKTTTHKDVTKQSETTKIITQKLNNRVGLKAVSSIDKPKILDYRIEASRRIFSSPMWIDGSYEINSKEIAIGVSYEF